MKKCARPRCQDVARAGYGGHCSETCHAATFDELHAHDQQAAYANDGLCSWPACSTAGRGFAGFCTNAHYQHAYQMKRRGRDLPPVPVCSSPNCTNKARSTDPNGACSQRCKSNSRYHRNKDTILPKQRVGMISEEARLARNARAAAWKAAHPERMEQHFRNAQLRKYGIDQQQYDLLLAASGGKCWVCTENPVEVTRSGKPRRRHVDHNHDYADGDPAGVRGLSCTGCNVRLAVLDDSELMDRIGRYLHDRNNYVPPNDDSWSKRTRQPESLYGLSTAQYLQMCAEQADRCLLCRQPSTYRDGRPRRLDIDHDHSKQQGTPGHIRGLLCSPCNTKVGIYENTQWRAKAEEYLRTGPQRVAEILGLQQHASA